jgi:hypothetical protein
VVTQAYALILTAMVCSASALVGDDPIVLNASGVAAPASASVGAPARLRRVAGRLVAEFVDGRSVDYDGLRDSEAFAEYLVLARSLNGIDLSALETQNARLAFWINLYNALVLHSVLESGVAETVREDEAFFSRYAYRVGGFTFTANDIEHGVLRGVSFADGDPRYQHAVPRLDPRLHFALNCASAGCPPIASYSAEDVDAELDLATASFVNSASEVDIDVATDTMHLSPIFDWYASDFGSSNAAIHRFVLAYLDPSDERDHLAANVGSIRIEFNAYDWSLNR